jgi:hypothetical protein
MHEKGEGERVRRVWKFEAHRAWNELYAVVGGERDLQRCTHRNGVIQEKGERGEGLGEGGGEGERKKKKKKK